MMISLTTDKQSRRSCMEEGTLLKETSRNEKMILALNLYGKEAEQAKRIQRGMKCEEAARLLFEPVQFSKLQVLSY